MPRPKRKSELLTSVELEFMMVLWSLGKGTVRQILDALNGTEKRAYTSVATILKVLDDKGYVQSQKSDRTLVYVPLVSKQKYEGKSLKSLSDTLFGGTPTALVARLVDDEELTDEMIREIRDIIDTKVGR